jgi:hypothetical protein
MTEIVVPKIGMGCTTGFGSDCYPHTIVKLYYTLSGRLKAFDMTDDIAIRTDDRGMYTEHQEYEYRFNPESGPTHVTLRSNGRWRVEGTTRNVHLGYRSYYRDPSF